jgi:hypothetical protein
MRENLRWVEEAEARQMREFAVVQHAAAEMRLTVVTVRRAPRLPRWLSTFIGWPSPRIVWSRVPGRH